MIPRTREIRIETSTLCNYHCSMCPRESFVREKTIMDNDLFFSLVDRAKDEMPRMDTITVSGFGEFMLDPHWSTKLEYARDNFAHVHVLTNGSLISEENMMLLLSLTDDIRISHYAVTADVYSRVHRSPDNVVFDELVHIIEKLSNTSGEEKEIILNYIEVDENRSQTAAWREKWEGKVDRIEMWKPHNWINGKAYRQMCEERKTSCGRPFNGPVQVQVDGTVNVCCFDYNGELLIGDAKTESFAEIFDGERMRYIRELHSSGRADELDSCRVCDQRNSDVCKKSQMLYSSSLAPEKRIGVTSTNYAPLGDD